MKAALEWLVLCAAVASGMHTLHSADEFHQFVEQSSPSCVIGLFDAKSAQQPALEKAFLAVVTQMSQFAVQFARADSAALTSATSRAKEQKKQTMNWLSLADIGSLDEPPAAALEPDDAAPDSTARTALPLKPSNTVVVYYPRVFQLHGQRRGVEYSGPASAVQLEHFIWSVLLPAVGLYSPASAPQFAHIGKPVLKLYVDMHAAHQSTIKSLVARLRQVRAATRQRDGSESQFAFALANWPDHQREIDGLWHGRAPDIAQETAAERAPFAVVGVQSYQESIAGAGPFAVTAAVELCAKYIQTAQPPPAPVAKPPPPFMAPITAVRVDSTATAQAKKQHYENQKEVSMKGAESRKEGAWKDAQRRADYDLEQLKTHRAKKQKRQLEEALAASKTAQEVGGKDTEAATAAKRGKETALAKAAAATAAREAKMATKAAQLVAAKGVELASKAAELAAPKPDSGRKKQMGGLALMKSLQKRKLGGAALLNKRGEIKEDL